DAAHRRPSRLTLERAPRLDRDRARHWIDEGTLCSAVPEQLVEEPGIQHRWSFARRDLYVQPIDRVWLRRPCGITANDALAAPHIVRIAENPVGPGTEGSVQRRPRIGAACARMVTGPTGMGVVATELLFPE